MHHKTSKRKRRALHREWEKNAGRNRWQHPPVRRFDIPNPKDWMSI